MEGGAERSYPLVRCAAFYLSMLEWAGEDALGLEQSQTAKLTVYNLTRTASSIRAEASGSTEHDQSNYAAVGQAWGADALWADDQAVCSVLTSGGSQ